METSSIRVVIPSAVEEPALSPPKGDPYPAEPFSPAQPAQQALGTTSFWAAQAFTECVSTQIGIVIPTRGRDLQHKRLSFRPTGGICSCFWAAQGFSPAINLLWNSGFSR